MSEVLKKKDLVNELAFHKQSTVRKSQVEKGDNVLGRNLAKISLRKLQTNIRDVKPRLSESNIRDKESDRDKSDEKDYLRKTDMRRTQSMYPE